MTRDSFGTAGTLDVGRSRHRIHRLAGIAPADLPYSLRIVLENLLRHEDGRTVTAEQIEALLAWGTEDSYARAVDLHAARVFVHDTNGVPPRPRVRGRGEQVGRAGDLAPNARRFGAAGERRAKPALHGQVDPHGFRPASGGAPRRHDHAEGAFRGTRDSTCSTQPASRATRTPGPAP